MLAFREIRLELRAGALGVLANAAILPMIVLAMLSIPQARAQQSTYTLETSTFRLVFGRVGQDIATSIQECVYTPTGTRFPMRANFPTTIANTDSGWNVPDSVTVVSVSPATKHLVIHFPLNRSITLGVTSHANFLEFELLNVTGDCGEIRLFGPIFTGLPQATPQGKGSNQITNLGNGYYACLVEANANTLILQSWDDPTTVLLGAVSPRYLPTQPGSSFRDQRFAFFICPEGIVKERFLEVQQYFNYPYDIRLKDNVENNIDYLFLMDRNGASARDIIQLCRETSLGAVLLFADVWSDFSNPDEPFKLRPGIRRFIDSLKAAGLIVGLHTFVHLVPANGYYAVHYPNQVSQGVIDRTFRSLTWTNTLPDSVALHFAAKADSLDPDWLYFDGNEKLIEINGQHVDYLNPYLEPRMTTKVLRLLRQRNFNLNIFQTGGAWENGYHYISRLGQRDYWDIYPGAGWTPMQTMDNTALFSTLVRRVFYQYADLGWFGREIHCNTCTGRRRDARWDEWQHLCTVSLNYNIPIGIRTTYNDFMTDSLRDRIVPLLRETIRQRRRLTVVEDKEHSALHFNLEQNYPNPFNPTTTIRFSIPQRSHVTLKVFDVLGREVATLVEGELNAGEHSVVFNAQNLPSGVYSTCLQAGSFVQQRKMVIIR